MVSPSSKKLVGGWFSSLGILRLLAGPGERLRPVFNITISNLPGSADPLYRTGARP